MDNKFFANILMCKNITEEDEIKDIFNIMILEDEQNDVLRFGVGIFMSSEIQIIKEEMFIVNLAYETEEGVRYYPIGTFRKNFESKGRSVDFFSFKNVSAKFIWEGAYRVEVRRCKSIVDINSIHDEELAHYIDGEEIINVFEFHVSKLMD